MKQLALVLFTIIMVITISACEGLGNTNEIEIPNNGEYYQHGEWTLESITEHFKELGFTSFEEIPYEPNEKNFRQNVFSVVIDTGWDTESEWDAGSTFDADDTIKIYYNKYPLLTVENCPDLLALLTGNEMDYKTFAEKYDGRYIEFEGYVHQHLTWLSSHIIDVAYGDYTNNGAPGHVVRVGDQIGEWGYTFLDESVEEGDLVVFTGKVSERWSEYYKQLYVRTINLEKR